MTALDWDAAYASGDIPWDKGEPHPALPLFLESHLHLFVKKPRIFHPGCGFGHDAAVLSEWSSELTALDLAAQAIATAKKLYPSPPHLRWEQGDLFTWPEKEHYDLVWEHTCISGLVPSSRIHYARSVHQVLKPGGILCGIFFLNPDHPPDEGPPFHLSRADLHGMFDFGFDLLEDLPNPPTYEGRENRETMMIWKKKNC
jgi:SAM-dependent methyltransferase